MKKGGLGSRLLVAVWGIPLILGLTWLGGWWAALLIAAISFKSQHEYYGLQKILGRQPIDWLGMSIGLVVILAWKTGVEIVPWILIAAFPLVAAVVLLREQSFGDLISTLGGVFYIPLLAGSFIFIRDYSGGVAITEPGRGLAFCIWGSLWIGDTAAYAGGRLLGKNKLAPAVSPNKTVEGFIFGFLGAILFCLVWWQFRFVSLTNCLVVGLAAGLLGQIGDLVESKLKRECSVKDAGSLLPGHGGMLDRFDSFLFTAPMVAMFLALRFYLR